jgi:hypothetical protein
MKLSRYKKVFDEMLERGLADYRLAVDEGEARGLSPTDILRAFVDDCDYVLAVVPENPERYVAIKYSEELKTPPFARTGAVPVRDPEEAVAMRRRFGDVSRVH